MSVHARLLVVVTAILMSHAAAFSQVPTVISYQGKLMESSGIPVADGPCQMTFAIYDAETGGSQLWTEANPSVQVKGGLFSVLLGSVTPFTAGLFDGPDRWFGVSIGDAAELSPRQKIASAAFAQVARTVVDGSITVTKLAPGAVTADKLAPNTITASQIADGTITTNKLAVGIAAPTGSISMFAGSTPPPGWLLCNGAAVSRTQYAALFAVIGTTYGSGDGSTTFSLPNLQGRVPVGQVSSQSEFNALGKTGGEKTHLLIKDEMPIHTHTQDGHSHGVSDPGHSHPLLASNIWNPSSAFTINDYSGDRIAISDNIVQGANSWYVAFSTIGSGTGIGVQTTAATNQNTGGGQAHNNLQPYVVVNYIIKM